MAGDECTVHGDENHKGGEIEDMHFCEWEEKTK